MPPGGHSEWPWSFSKVAKKQRGVDFVNALDFGSIRSALPARAKHGNAE